jgi:hypothetical protein
MDIFNSAPRWLSSSWLWLCVSWIYNYICNQCLSSLTVRVRIPLRRGVLDTILCDKVCQWFAAGRWQSPSIPISFTNETDCHDITEILLKVALNTTTQTLTFFSDVSLIDLPSFIQKQFGMNHNPIKSCIQWYLISRVAGYRFLLICLNSMTHG